MTKLMGILNVTPDSFSDGGQHFAPEAALAAVKRMAEEGADIIDIGAESTRPGAIPLTPEEEWQRLAPVLSQLPREKMKFSLDTRHAETAAKALQLGVDWINDVSGFENPSMVEAVRKSDCKLVVMHSLSVPADKNIVLAENANAMEEVFAFAKQRLADLQKAGISKERLIFDPGIGFGKTAAQSELLLREIGRFLELNVPILVGHSRKSFLVGSPAQRDEATLAISTYLAQKNIAYLRVHDIAAHRKMLNTLEAA